MFRWRWRAWPRRDRRPSTSPPGAPVRESGFDAIYSSPLRRAWRTAVTIGDWLGLAPLPVPELREMSGGAVEGLTDVEWRAAYPELVAGWSDAANLDFGWPEGETRRAFPQPLSARSPRLPPRMARMTILSWSRMAES